MPGTIRSYPGRVRHLLRASEWWHAKPPVILALAYYQLALATPTVSLGRALVAIALFTVATIGIAGFGHVVNDLFDRELDERVAAPNAVAALGNLQVAAIIGVLLLFAWLPWVWLPTSVWTLGLLGLEFVLFIAYSAPPMRLKARGLSGVLADSLYGYTVPGIVALLVFGRLGHTRTSLPLTSVIAAWTFALGCRWILTHQLEELVRDQRLGVGTYAVRHGWEHTLRLLASGLLPVESALFVLALGWLGRHAVIVPIGFVVWVVGNCLTWRPLRVARLKTAETSRRIRRLVAINVEVMSRFQTQWLPVLMLVVLVWRAPAFLVLLALHLYCFESGPLTLVRQDLPAFLGSLRTPRWAAR